MAQKTRPKRKATSTNRAPRRAARPIRGPGDWRDDALARVRSLILEAEPEMVEERKWKKPSNPSGVPVWSHHGIVCTGETYRSAVKLTFARGASLPDPSGLFNSSLEGATRRAIDIHEGENIDARAFKTLIRAAVGLNTQSGKGRRPALANRHR